MKLLTDIPFLQLAVSLVAVSSDTAVGGGACRSNATHIAWCIGKDNGSELRTMPAFARRRGQTLVQVPGASSSSSCTVQLRKDAEKECLQYLQDNIMAFDIPFRGTMGFPDGTDDSADGLGFGLIAPTIQLALDAKIQYAWTDELPKYIFFNYVLNYANFNEARNNWRPLLVERMKFNESDLWKSGSADLTSTVTWVNTNLWSLLGQNGSPIHFSSGQTPLIFDPMSVIAYGYASCTGTSILFSNALRAVGIPARVVGTPAWYGNYSQGNHNWVEVYVGGSTGDDVGNSPSWKFLEPSPALPNVDTLEKDPCSRWFCGPSRYPASKVYAARMSKRCSCDPDPPVSVPLAWELDCHDVPGIDRTQYYTDVCGLCED